MGLARSGESVGNYRLLGTIGSGGMGMVYVAEHLLLGRRAAIKFLHPNVSGEPEMVERFFNEARAASAVKHPGIVEVYDFGYRDGLAYLVMEYLDGESLLSHLRVEGSLSVARTLAIARKVTAALIAAHDAGVVHRDLKPDNIFLVRDAPDVAPEARGRVCLLDFGVAKLLRSDGSFSASTTATGVLVGTPAYMSPEQCRGGGQIDGRSDLYSLGCVLYGMLSGRPPFIGEGGGDVLAHHIFVAPEPPSSHAPRIPPALDALVLRLLEKDPGKRHQSARELGRALAELADRSESVDETIERGPGPRPMAWPAPVAGRAPEAAGKTPRPQVDEAAPTVVVATPIPVLVTQSGPVALAPLLEPTGATRFGWLARAPRLGWLARLPRPGWLARLPRLGWLASASRRFLDDRRIWMPVAGAGVLLLLLALFLRGGSSPRPESPPPAAQPAIGSGQVAEQPTTVEIVITSIPTGAMVIDQTNGERLGPSPFRAREAARPGLRAFLLQKEGYEPEVVTVRSDVSSEAQVVLAAVSSAAPAPAPAAPAPRLRPPPRRDKAALPPVSSKKKQPDAVGDGSLDPFEK